MKMIPSCPIKFVSSAEEKVYLLLEQMDLGKGATAIHSQNVSEHAYKKWCELDYVIVFSWGVLILEVKGGRVTCSNGIWTYTNRHGKSDKNTEGPFRQAESGMYALKKYLKRLQTPRNADLKLQRVCFGWGAVFPDQEPQEFISPEVPAEVMLQRQMSSSPITQDQFKRFLEELGRYWFEKGSGQYRKLTPADLETLVSSVKPDFECLPSMGARLEAIEEERNKLTDGQSGLLVASEDNPRILCRGGAGTGKTFVAIETARRESVHGRQCLFLCRNPVLAGFIRARVEDANVRVMDFGQIRETGESGAGPKKFDSLIVDEAQDILTVENMIVISSMIKGGLEKGRWRIFMDQNNQSSIYDDPEPEAVALLQREDVVSLKLTDNCRNTDKIVFDTQLYTGADIGEAKSEIPGPNVARLYYNGDDKGVVFLGEKIREWLEDYKPQDIAILSPGNFQNSIANRLGRELREMIKPMTLSATMRSSKHICYSNIKDFKGLEQNHVVLVDLDGFDGCERWNALFYVGMTRARVNLCMLLPNAIKDVLTEIARINIEKMPGAN